MAIIFSPHSAAALRRRHAAEPDAIDGPFGRCTAAAFETQATRLAMLTRQER